MEKLRIGIDIGGTFTDFVIFDPNSGKLETFKLLSTPQDPSLVVLSGLERILKKKWTPGCSDPRFNCSNQCVT